MNKKILILTIISVTIVSATIFSLKGSNLNMSTDSVILLPDPQSQFAKYNDSLYLALKNRQSNREFSSEALDINELSALLWAASGVNRDNGKLTLPTSSNSQDTYIYILNSDGVWHYNPNGHSIEKQMSKDLRSYLRPSFAKEAPMTLLYVQDSDKASNRQAGDKHAGSMYQNVALYSAIANLNNVVVGSFGDDVVEQLNLPSNYRVVVSQIIGKAK